MKMVSSLGLQLLSVWLILYGVVGLLSLSFNGLPLVMAALALAAGICILIGR